MNLVQDEQNEGPLSVTKNSIYYETKFEKMMQEIRDLRQQLQEKDNDFKRLREEMSGQSKRKDFRRAVSLESDTVDTEKQLTIAHQETAHLKERLRQMELNNEQLVNENHKLLSSNQSPSPRHANHQPVSESISHTSSPSQIAGKITQDKYSDLQHESSKLITELNCYRKSRPDIGKFSLGLSSGSSDKRLGNLSPPVTFW